MANIKGATRIVHVSDEIQFKKWCSNWTNFDEIMLKGVTCAQLNPNR